MTGGPRRALSTPAVRGGAGARRALSAQPDAAARPWRRSALGLAAGLSCIAVGAAIVVPHATPTPTTAVPASVLTEQPAPLRAVQTLTPTAVSPSPVAGATISVAPAPAPAAPTASATAKAAAAARPSAPATTTAAASGQRVTASPSAKPAPASSTAPAPAPSTQAAPATTPAASGAAATIVAYVKARIGAPYRVGSTGPTYYDCAGLVYAAHRAAGVSMTYSEKWESTHGTSVALADLRPGDVVVLGSPVHAVGIYVGDDTMVIADGPSYGVRAVKLSARWSWDTFGGARRYT